MAEHTSLVAEHTFLVAGHLSHIVLSPLQLWNVAMSKYKVLEECATILEALGPEDTSSEKEQALRDETMAIAEAVQALRRLASDTTRAELEKFIRESEPERLVCHDSAERKPPDARARVELQTFLRESVGERVVMKLRHEPQLLSSFDEDFWTHVFVDLFCRGDCREKYVHHKPQ